MHQLVHAQRNKQPLCQERLHCNQQRMLLPFNSDNSVYLNDFQATRSSFKTELS